MEPLRVAKCEPGMTPDGQVVARDGYSQKFGRKAICVFLNDVPEGGEVLFPSLGLQVRPQEGCAVVWSVVTPDGQEDLRAAHQGRPPKAGIRYTAMAVFRSKSIR